MSDRRKKSETNPEPGLVTCPHCGRSTPEENLRCIYCGELLDRPVGPMSELVFGLKGRLGLIIALIVIAAFLVWFL